jgi:pyruvate-formate lyase-activating enzyme
MYGAFQWGSSKSPTDPETGFSRGACDRMERTRGSHANPASQIGAQAHALMRISGRTRLCRFGAAVARPLRHYGEPLGDPAMNLRPDRIAVLFLQPQCNMTCRFCITQDGFSVMDPEDVRALLDGLARLGIGNVIFGGGEPLAWPYDLLGPARYARELGMTVQVGSNGIGLAPRIMQSPALDRFILPLESAEARVHNRLRRARGGHHAIILDRLEALADLGREVTLSTVITRANRDGLMALAEWIAGYQARGGRVHAWHLYRFLALGRGGSIAGAALGTTADEYRAACAAVGAAFPGLPVLKRPDMTRSRTVGFYWMENDQIRWSGPHGSPALRMDPVTAAFG